MNSVLQEIDFFFLLLINQHHTFSNFCKKNIPPLFKIFNIQTVSFKCYKVNTFIYFCLNSLKRSQSLIAILNVS